ncbi:MAG: PAS domain S-box protein, partial [Smithellaceae bacterium]|nr:PAS domain S-box protein [Smithellaceae bacterium]
SVLDQNLAVLKALSLSNRVIRMEEDGKALLRATLQGSGKYVQSVSRISPRGKIVYTFPSVPGVIGTDISGQPHIREALQTKKPVVSDSFKAVQGFPSVAVHVPVFRGKTFDGTVGFLIAFTDLAKDYLDNLYLPGDRFALLINSRGKIIHCINPAHSGHPALAYFQNEREAEGMVKGMIDGKEGEATLNDAHLSDRETKPQRVHAVYAPLRVGNGYWSVAVMSTERLMLPWAKNIRTQLLVLALMVIVFFTLTVYAAARLRSAAVEAQKRRKIEDDLLDSAREISDLYHNAPCGYLSFDASAHIVRINDRLLSWLGYAREELLGISYELILVPDSRMLFAETFARLKEEGLARDVEYEMMRKDQTTFSVLVNTTAITDAGGRFVMSRTMVLDITKRRVQEERLRESEELYRKAIESTSDGVTIIQDGKYVYVSRKFLDTMGVDRDAIIDRPLGILAGPDAQAGLKAFLNRHPQSAPAQDIHITRVPKADGSVIYLQSSSVDIVYRGKPAILTFIKDITKERDAQQALRESEELYRTALESTSDGITITDVADGRYLYINQKLMNTLGRPGENLTGKPLDLYMHPDDVGLGTRHYRERRKSGKPASVYDARILKPDGSVALIGITAVDIVFQGRRAVLSFIQDITEKKKAEQALRESEEFYRTALEKSNDGITIIQNGKYVYANQRLLRTIGREETGILGLPLGSYTHPDDRDMVERYYEARKKGEWAPSSYDMRVLKPDGSVITININAVAITYRGEPATLSFVLDITERKRAEEALRQSEERYRTIIESIDDDYFETDLQGRITFFNKSVGWAGYTREELIGISNDRYARPDMAEKIEKAFRRIYQDGKPGRILDYEIIRKDGSLAHLELSVSLIRDARGKPVGFRGISRDVTERFKMEHERKKLTEQLYQAQKMEAIGTLAGGIAHDFNNLLMGIQGYTSLMLLETRASEASHEQLSAVQTLVQSGANLTRQLLGFARAGRNAVVSTNLNDLVAKTIKLFSRTRKEIRIFEKYRPDLWTADVDRGQIEQVLLNMFVNAWQAMPGGGSLYLETENVVLDDAQAKISSVKTGRYARIAVTDTGVGMDETTRQRIFDPFFTTKGMGRGSGLGLASAYGIIKGHSGMISVYSEKGKGSTFNIYLPASFSKLEEEETSEAEPPGGEETILLVDDEKVITEVTGRLLEELGYRILTAGSGQEAVALYTEKHAAIDLVILDMIMPGLSGSATFDRLKAVNPAVRVILSSGYSQNGKAQAIMDKGVRFFLQKPYRLYDLAKKIREALSD